MSLLFTIQELSEYVEEIFPQIKDDFEILEISEHGCRVKLNVNFKHLKKVKTLMVFKKIFSYAFTNRFLNELSRLVRFLQSFPHQYQKPPLDS